MTGALDALERQGRPRWAEVLRLLFGIGCEPLTTAEVARRLGVATSRVQQIMKKALAKLTAPGPGGAGGVMRLPGTKQLTKPPATE